MACKVFRDQNNKISRVLDTNGQDSKLYKELVNYAKEEPNVFVDDYHVQDLASKGLIIDTSAEELALGGWDKAYVKYQIVEEPTLDSIKNDLFADSLFTQSSILDKNTVKNSFYIPNEMSKKELEELYLNGGSKAMEKVRRSFFFDNEVKREDYFNPDNYNVYHGTKDLDIDSNGVLTIKPSKNFNNKTDNISLTQLPGVAMDYAIRKKGLYIVRINNQYIKDDFQVENTEEISVKNKLVLNKGEYEVLEFINFDILEEREIKEKVQEKYQSKSLFYLYEMYYNMDTYDSVESDVAENDDSSKDIRRYYDPERGIEKQTLRELLKEYEGLDMTPSVVKYLTDYIHTKEEFLYKKPTLNDLMSLEMGYEYLGEFIYNLLGTKILTNQIGGNIGRSKSYFSKDEQLKILQEIIDDFNYERLLNNLGYNEEPVFADSLFTEPLFQEPKEVNYRLKAVDILLSDKAKQVFSKGQKAGWSLDKILTELQVPKEQKQLILDLGIIDKEQLALELVSNYSYAVEINTAKSTKSNFDIEGYHYNRQWNWRKNKTEDYLYFKIKKDSKDYINDDYLLDVNNSKYLITKEEFETAQNSLNNTQYYANLAVPGGTNYTEQEISTPAITPSIKGHAQFATDKGIGWFRSDEQVNNGIIEDDFADLDEGERYYAEWVAQDQLLNTKRTVGGTSTKTRRILEVQSDLFQKGRDEKKALSWNKYILNDKGDVIGENPNFQSEQDFLNLLRKDNNWVTFFIKSIIQDSAKKGYEKVLFPTGDTASKVEGHTTLEEFKKQKEDRIKLLEQAKKEQSDLIEDDLPFFDENGTFSDKKVTDLSKIDNEITQLKQELERVETEGFGALRPIFNFYENVVTNILKKQYGKENVKLVTDEYGNTWNEIVIDKQRDLNNILLRKDSPNKQESKLDIQTYDKLLNLVHKLGFNIERMEEWKEKWEKKNGRKFDDSGILGLTDFVNKALVLNDSSDITFGEEAAHIIISSVKDTPQYKRAMEEVVNTQEYRDNYDAYMELYKDVEKVKEEVLGKILLNKIMNGSTREGLSSRLFKALSDIWMKVKEMFTGNKTAELRSFINEVYSNIQNENMGFFGEVSSEGQLYRIDEDAYKTSKKLKLYEDKLREAIKVRIKKFKIYKNKRTEKGNERELERIDKLMKLLANDQIDLGIVTYINHANEELEVAHNRFKELLDNINSKNYRELAEQLNTLRSYIAAHKPLVKGLVKDLRRLPDDIKEELIILNAAIDTIEQEFFESSSYILAEQLLPFYTTIPELGITTVSQVQDLLMKAPKDISWFSAWFRSMANSGDLILQGLDQIIKSATIKAQEEADSLIRSLYKVNRLVDKPYEWMLNGRYFISKYDMQKWNSNLEKFMTELYTKYNLPADKKERDAFFDTLQLEATSAYADSIINDYITARLEVLNATEHGVDALKRSKKQKGLSTELARVNWAIDQVYNMYKVDQARWFESNTQTNPEYAKIIEERLREFFDSRMDEDQQKDEYFAYVINKVLSDATNLYGEKYSNYPKNISDPSTNRNLKMVIEDAQHWVSSNRGFSEYKAKNGESGFYYKRRLSLPSDLYLDSRFDAIQKDVNKKAYYDKVIELKKQMDSYLPEEHRDEFLIPQIRKDFLERLVKSPKTVLQEVKDGVIIREDDTEFGMDYQLTDENNNPVKMLPVFYTRNIERLEDMSTDITSVMAAFINMATRHKQMSEIESTMELALINVENRQIEIGDDVLGKGDSKFSQFFKGSKNIDRKLGGNAADALREYINMQVYGERKERQEFEFFGAKVSFSKLTDLFNTYVSLNTLAFNPYSAIANITTSSVYRRMEAAAGQFYNNKNLLWADAFYRKNITGVLNDVGKLESNNPLRLFLEYTDALDSFDKDVRGANAERSRFGRAFNTSSLFAFQHIGDHIVQSRVALAMADKFEVFNSKGEKIHLIKDALIFGENELRIEEGTKKKDGTPLTIQDLKFFGNKVKKVNQDLDGIYNDADAAAAQKYAQGRIVMLYRKYLVPGLDKRFRGISGGKIADLTLETTKEGMYITSGRFMYNLMKEVKANHWRLLSTTKEEWNNLSDADKQNIIRTTTEMAYIFAIAIIGTILTEASDDDEENGMLALAAYSANRLYTELRQYNNISEAYKILKSPAAGIRQLENLTEIFSKTFDPLGYVFSDDPFLREYKSGKNEGQTYFWVKTQKALPFVNTFDKWKNPREQLQYMK